MEEIDIFLQDSAQQIEMLREKLQHMRAESAIRQMLLYPMSCAYADAAAKKCCSDTRSLAAKKQYSRPCAGC